MIILLMKKIITVVTAFEMYSYIMFIHSDFTVLWDRSFMAHGGGFLKKS